MSFFALAAACSSVGSECKVGTNTTGASSKLRDAENNNCFYVENVRGAICVRQFTELAKMPANFSELIEMRGELEKRGDEYFLRSESSKEFVRVVTVSCVRLVRDCSALVGVKSNYDGFFTKSEPKAGHEYLGDLVLIGISPVSFDIDATPPIQ